jgi:GDP-L-fucose synthase
VIPAIIRKVVEAQEQSRPEIMLWGTGQPTREFLYVDDAAEAICRATALYDDKDPVNVGTGHEISIRDLAATVARLAGFTGTIRFDASKPDGQPRRVLNVERARVAFGFEATTALEEGLRRTIAWYRANRAHGPRFGVERRRSATTRF